jgi:hypothetical protein
VFIPLHRGSDGFMSLKQFERFSWPQFEEFMLFQNSDLFRAKEIVGDTMRIMGGMPVSLLRSGSREQIRERTHEACLRAGWSGRRSGSGWHRCCTRPSRR